MRAYGRGGKRDRKGSEDSSPAPVISAALPAASAPNSPLPSLAGRRFNAKQRSVPQKQPQPQPPPPQQPAVPPASATQSPRKKNRAPPIPTSQQPTVSRSGDSTSSRSSATKDHLHIRCPSAPVGSPEQIANAGRADDDSVQSVCQGRVRAAMHHLMDNLPYADDSAEQDAAATAAVTTAAPANAAKSRPTNRSFKAAPGSAQGEWQSDNCYWKRALLQSEPPSRAGAATPEPPQRVPPARSASVANGNRAAAAAVGSAATVPFAKVRSNSSSGLVSASSMAGSLRGAAGHPPQKLRAAIPRMGGTAGAPTLSRGDRSNNNGSGGLNDGAAKGSGGEEEEEPPRGLVRNMVSRFQKPT